MFESYKATESDIKAIPEAIKYVWNPQLDYIFKDRLVFDELTIVSFDSQQIFFWSKKEFKDIEKLNVDTEGFYGYTVPHNHSLTDKEQLGWATSFRFAEMKDALPQELTVDWQIKPFISGGLLKPFTVIQEKSKRVENAYTTHESYLATIVHEFGHVYFNHFKHRYHGDKPRNILWLNTAKALYQGESPQISRDMLYVIVNSNVSELFAFCTDYSVAEIFWPTYLSQVNGMNSIRMEKLIKLEEQRDCYYESSVLDESAHNYAAVVGRIMVKLFPQNWPEVLLGMS